MTWHDLKTRHNDVPISHKRDVYPFHAGITDAAAMNDYNLGHALCDTVDTSGKTSHG